MVNGTPENLNQASINKDMYIKVKKLKARCKKCNAQVSQNAKTCWSCGAKTGSSQSALNIVLIVGAATLVIFLLSKLG